MKVIKFEDCSFHDRIIKNIDYDGKDLILSIDDSDSSYKLTLNKYDITIYQIKQYPRFHKVKLKGKEIQVDNLKSILINGNGMQIINFSSAIDTYLITLECEVLPYIKKRGVYNKIILKLSCSEKVFTLMEQGENGY